MINLSKETVYHRRQGNVQSVHSMYEVTERDRKLKPGWKVLVGGLCTLAMLLECTNVVLSSRRENNDHPIDSEMRLPRVLPVRNDTMCEHGGHQFNLGKSNKRPMVCSYERRVLIDVREFIGDRPTSIAHDKRSLYPESTYASGERRTDASDEIITRLFE